MRLYRDHVLPRIVHKARARKDFNGLRRDALAGLSGVVVEIGFGSGHNLPHYPPEVRCVLAIEPSGQGDGGGDPSNRACCSRRDRPPARLTCTGRNQPVVATPRDGGGSR